MKYPGFKTFFFQPSCNRRRAWATSTTIVSDRGKSFTDIIKSDLTDVTDSQSKITFVFWQIYKLTHIFFFFFLCFAPLPILTLLIKTNK